MTRLGHTIWSGVRARLGALWADAVFIGYPKTGNTWVRFLVGSYVAALLGHPQRLLFDHQPSMLPIRGTPVPRYRFTHDPLRWVGQTAADLRHANVTRPFAKRRVILLVRHPLDVLVSNWHHCHNRTPRLFGGELDEFIDDSVFGLDKLMCFYSLWAERLTAHVHVLRYEDLHHQALSSVEALIRVLRLDYEERLAEDAIAASSFEEMRAIERLNPAFRYHGGAPVFSPRLNEGESPHMRRGAVGAYRDELPSSQVVELESRVRRGMPEGYGYA